VFLVRVACVNIVVVDVELGSSSKSDELLGFTIFILAIVMGNPEMLFQIIVFFVENVFKIWAADMASKMVAHVDH
jgi:hypothetical protein